MYVYNNNAVKAHRFVVIKAKTIAMYNQCELYFSKTLEKVSIFKQQTNIYSALSFTASCLLGKGFKQCSRVI